jgi:RNA polymerase sigma-70 factor, ECF subfamily
MDDGEQFLTVLMRELNHALGQLPARQRAVLLLVTLEEMTYDQVARTLDIPVDTVMSSLARAREHVRDAVLGAAKLRVVN